MPRSTRLTGPDHDHAIVRLDRAIRIALAAVAVGEGAFPAERDDAFAPSPELARRLGNTRLAELTPHDADEVENYLVERGRALGHTRAVDAILRRGRQRERELGHASAVDAILRRERHRERRRDAQWRIFLAARPITPS